MRSLNPSLLVPLVLLAMAGCDRQPTGPNGDGTELDSRVEAIDGATAALTISQDGIIESLGEVPGAIHEATLVRNQNSAQVRLSVWAPAPNTATLWAVVFNVPTECDAYPDPCGLGDLGNPDVMASVGRVGGRVIGGSGVTTITGNVREGDASELLFGTPLLDAMTAEIHFIFRLHGPPIPGMVAEQIHTVGGGCGINTCGDAAAAIFQSP